MIQLIASDMDGTLLGTKMNVSEENIAAIKKAEKLGVIFMVATGRGYTEAKPPLDDAGIDCAMITVNGAQAFDKEGNELFTIDIPLDNSKKIMALLTDHDIYYEIATNQGVYSDNRHQRIENVATMLAHQLPHLTYKMAVAMASAHLALLEVNYVEHYRELFEKENMKILKFIVFSQEGQKVLAPLRSKVEELPDLVVTSSFENNIEINHIEAQKGNAVKHVAKKLGIPLEQVMTIGDNFNDVSMLELTTVSFAMGNAEQEVKDIARYVTEHHTEGGVGKAIHRAIDENL